MSEKTQTRLERGQIVATDTCTEFRNIFRRYHGIVIWKESRSSKRRALHKGNLGNWKENPLCHPTAEKREQVETHFAMMKPTLFNLLLFNLLLFI